MNKPEVIKEVRLDHRRKSRLQPARCWKCKKPLNKLAEGSRCPNCGAEIQTF